MNSLKRILLATDFSTCAEQAFAWALELAKTFDADLHIFHGVVLGGVLDEQAQSRIEGLERIAGELDAMAVERVGNIANETPDTVRVESIIRRGIAAPTLIRDYIEEAEIDLTVMGTHGRRGVANVLLGSVAEEVVRTAACPVLTVRERNTPVPLSSIQNILVPLDLSERSLRAIAYAKALASSYQARLQLLHVVERPTYPSFYALKQSYLMSLLGDIEQRAKEALVEAMEDAEGSRVPFDTHVAEGQAVPAILDFAQHSRSDLIVVTTHGLTGLKRLLVGSVTEKVVRRARMPVLTVKVFQSPSR